MNTELMMQALMGGMNPQVGNPLGVSIAAPKQSLWQRGPAALMGSNAPTPGGGLEALMGNPLFGASLGLLSASRDGSNPYQSALAGMLGTSVYKRQSQEYDLKAKQFEAEQQQAQAQQKLMESNRREATKLYETFSKRANEDGTVDPWEQGVLSQLQTAIETGSNLTDVVKQLKPPEETKTTQMKNAEAMGRIPGTPEYQDAIAQSAFKPLVEVHNQERIPPPERGYKYIDPDRPELGTTYVPGGGADPSNPQNWTEGERAASGFRQRMQSSEAALASVPVPTNADFFQTFGSKGTLQNLLASPDYREYVNLAADWIRAKLRKESGAVIGDDEMQREFDLYFWTPGDTDRDARRKLARRIMADRQMALSAGRAVVTPDARAKELRSEGFSDEEIADMLLQEGLIRD